MKELLNCELWSLRISVSVPKMEAMGTIRNVKQFPILGVSWKLGKAKRSIEYGIDIAHFFPPLVALLNYT